MGNILQSDNWGRWMAEGTSPAVAGHKTSGHVRSREVLILDLSQRNIKASDAPVEVVRCHCGNVDEADFTSRCLHMDVQDGHPGNMVLKYQLQNKPIQALRMSMAKSLEYHADQRKERCFILHLLT